MNNRLLRHISLLLLFIAAVIPQASAVTEQVVIYSPVMLEQAEKGDARAMSLLAQCYLSGAGIQRDAAKAIDWYTRAAELGDTVSTHQLGYIYYSGAAGRTT